MNNPTNPYQDQTLNTEYMSIGDIIDYIDPRDETAIKRRKQQEETMGKLREQFISLLPEEREEFLNNLRYQQTRRN